LMKPKSSEVLPPGGRSNGLTSASRHRNSDSLWARGISSHERPLTYWWIILSSRSQQRSDPGEGLGYRPSRREKQPPVLHGDD
jgi:hypothetical protein